MIRVALFLGIVLEVIEIFRRAPAWLLVLLVTLVASVVCLVAAYFWWVTGGLAAVAVWRLARRATV